MVFSDEENFDINHDVKCDFYTDKSFNDKFNNSDQSLFILHHNIRSFNANFDEFSVFLHQLSRPADILVLSETWFKDSNCGEIDGYRSFHACRVGKDGGGVSVFVRNGIKCNVIQKFVLVNNIVESVCVEISMGGKVVNVLGIYRPPSPNNIQQFIEILDDTLSMFHPSDHLMVCGDTNIDLIDLSNNGNSFVDLMRSYSLFNCISLPTRISNHSCSLIDHIWTNYLPIEIGGTFVNDVTDHFPVFVLFPFDFNSNLFVKKFRDHSRKCLDSLYGSVQPFVSNFLSDREGDVSVRTSIFHDKLLDIYNKCCPVRSKTLSRSRVMKPWLTADCLRVVNRKHELYREFRGGTVSYNVMKNYKTYACRTIKQAKIDYFHNKFKSSFNSISSTWKFLNQLMNRNRKKKQWCIKFDNVKCFKPKTIADNFNQFFASISTNIDNLLPRSNISPLQYMGPANEHTFFASPATSNEIENIITSFVSKKAVVIPLFKAGDSLDVNNYRPISTLPVLSKIMEKLMLNRMLSFIDKCNLLAECQFGFRVGMSTVDAVHQYMINVYETIEQSEFLFTVLIDLRKAFDCVNLDILLLKLEHLGFRGCSTGWFESYLKDRRQCVVVDGHMSSELTMVRGVPQGSTLGPLLFLLYINDMHKSSDKLSFTHFADDTTVSCHDSSFERAKSTVETELNKVSEWLVCNRLSLNVNKTACLIFSNRSVLSDVNVLINNNVISVIEYCKFLGIVIDNRMSFRYHVNNMCKKLSCVVGIARKISKFIPKPLIRSLYFSLFYPHLVYGITVWGSASHTLLKRIETIQKRIVKLLPFNACPFLENNILPFYNLYKFFVLLRMYKIIHDHDNYFSSFVDSLLPDHKYNTRAALNNIFNLPLFRTSKSQTSFLYRGVQYWNALPGDFKRITDFNKFKTSIYRQLINL